MGVEPGKVNRPREDASKPGDGGTSPHQVHPIYGKLLEKLGEEGVRFLRIDSRSGLSLKFLDNNLLALHLLHDVCDRVRTRTYLALPPIIRSAQGERGRLVTYAQTIEDLLSAWNAKPENVQLTVADFIDESTQEAAQRIDSIVSKLSTAIDGFSTGNKAYRNMTPVELTALRDNAAALFADLKELAQILSPEPKSPA